MIKAVFKDLRKIQDLATNLSEEGALEVQKFIPIDNVNIEFRVAPEWAMPGYGYGGYSLNKNTIIIPVDSDFKNLEGKIREGLKRTVAHELYHVLQGYTFEKGGNALLESLIHEGLADHFELEVFGGKPGEWTQALKGEDLEKWSKVAEKEFENREYNHDAWFRGVGGEIPHWAGYSVGFDLVEKYFKKHPDQKPSTVYKLEAKDFLI